MSKKQITLFLLALMALSAFIIPVSAYDPFVTVSMDKPMVNEGEIITFNGIAEGSATIIQFFIIGDNYQECTAIDLNNDKTYAVTVDTEGLKQGIYYVIVSNPNIGEDCAITFSYDDDAIVYYNDKSQGRFSTFKGASGAQKIATLLSRSDCDDVFLQTSFYVNNQPISEPTNNNDMTVFIVICVVILGLCAIPFIIYNLPKNNSNTDSPIETHQNLQNLEVMEHNEDSRTLVNNNSDAEYGGFCPECGKPYKTGSQFCKHCGRRL